MNCTNIINNIEVSYLPKVSVIIATFRRKGSLNVAVESLLNQTYSNIEIIIVDDNGVKKWNNEVKMLLDSIIKKNNIPIIYIINEKNIGSAESRNRGIEKATGEYITFLDDDDFYLPDKIKKQVYHMLERNSDFSISDIWLYDEDGILIEKRIRNYIKDYSIDSLLRYHLMYHITGTDAIMFKKDYLVKIGMFSPINVGDEFYLIEKAILGKGVFSYLPGCEIKAYVHSNTEGLSSGNSKINGENILYEYKKKYFKFLRKKDINYIRMRHFAVLAFAYLREKKYLYMSKNILISFLSSPAKFLNLVFFRKK